MTTITAPTTSPPRALTIDERLALAALAVDARITTTPVDLDDVIRLPVTTPLPAGPCPYRTPIAALLHRAWVRIETVGWCRDALFDESGAVCPIRAIRLEADSPRQADEACFILLEAIKRHWQAETIPSWNAQQTSSAPVLLAFDRAANLAHSRNL
ncbi:DUF6197 family protein [Streptomyces reticuli]|uniref:DUF6197 family protein n=1 Tax=Streptomyces reticuli TaxID=1926 RepID=UPI00073DCCBC|nr:hypothetical protein [Streptomyces sp. SID7810]CUW31766.1 hypothetical protein TUE45_06515 [Streptomyces reticuli]